MITITQYEKDEWSRLAQHAYAIGRNSVGHRYSVAASIPNGYRMDVKRYDVLQGAYRKWLVFNEMPEA